LSIRYVPVNNLFGSVPGTLADFQAVLNSLEVPGWKCEISLDGNVSIAVSVRRAGSHGDAPPDIFGPLNQVHASLWTVRVGTEVGEEEKEPLGRIQGTAISWNDERRFGFVQSDTGQRFFVYIKNLSSALFPRLTQGERVEFMPEKSKKGWRAREVVSVAPPPPYSWRDFIGHVYPVVGLDVNGDPFHGYGNQGSPEILSLGNKDKGSIRYLPIKRIPRTAKGVDDNYVMRLARITEVDGAPALEQAEWDTPVSGDRVIFLFLETPGLRTFAKLNVPGVTLAQGWHKGPGYMAKPPHRDLNSVHVSIVDEGAEFTVERNIPGAPKERKFRVVGGRVVSAEK